MVTNSTGCTVTSNVSGAVTVSPTSVGGTATAGASSVCSGSSTTITVAGYTGTIQWQQSANGTSGWGSVTGGSGGTTPTYTTPNLTTTTYYRALVTSGACSAVASTVAQVTVNSAPSITTQPANQTVTYGDASATFSVVATGTPAPTYQWQINPGFGFIPIPSANSASYSQPNPAVSNSTFQYQVVVTNTCGTVTSDPAVLTVNPAPLTITANNQSKTYGATLTLNGTEFTSTALQNGETIGSVTLTSSGTAAGAGVSGSPYDIVPSDATGGTFDPGNYAITYNNGSLTVGKANATISVTPYTTIYDGTAHIASGTATGAQNEDLSSLLDFSSTSHTNAGTYSSDTWSFPGRRQS